MTGFSSRAELRRLYREARERVPKEMRLMLSGTCEYLCVCGASLRVQVATGVGPGPNDVPPPREIPCLFCDDAKMFNSTALALTDRGNPIDTSRPYLRIPSGSMLHVHVALRRFEAELVEPRDGIVADNGPDEVERWGDELI